MGTRASENYNLILVDDEAIVRQGIAQCVAWGENGFHLSGLFEHGREALEYIEKHQVDVVISDINMPHMDGLSLSRILAERYPSIMVLLLTGYDDFEYAQEAVKHQVRQFLLKPITAAELSGVLQTVQEELDRLRHRERQQALMQEKLTLSFPLLKERFLLRLVTGRIEAEGMNRRREYFQWHDLKGFYQVLLFRIPEEWSDLQRITLLEYLKSRIRPEDEVFQNSDEQILLLLQELRETELNRRSAEVARAGFQQAEEISSLQISVGSGEVVESVFDLQRSHRGAQTAADYSLLIGMNQVISISELRDRERISPEGFVAVARKLIDRLKEGRRIETESALEEVFSYLEEHYLTPAEAAHYLNRLHIELVYFLPEIGIETGEALELNLTPEILGSVASAKEFFREMINSIEDRIADSRHDMLISRIERAKKIIAERFAEKDFSLKDICDELYLSTSQFSLLFKEGTGQTFVEYLTAYRVEEAKKLLKTTDLKGYEIADTVGYADPRYFTIIFKKVSGMTAMEYRRSLEE